MNKSQDIYMRGNYFLLKAKSDYFHLQILGALNSLVSDHFFRDNFLDTNCFGNKLIVELSLKWYHC